MLCNGIDRCNQLLENIFKDAGLEEDLQTLKEEKDIERIMRTKDKVENKFKRAEAEGVNLSQE
jgi:hypothetical protein